MWLVSKKKKKGWKNWQLEILMKQTKFSIDDFQKNKNKNI